MKKRQRLPFDYLEKYIGIKLEPKELLFIKGCLVHQKKWVQLNNLQWKVIKDIEQKYFFKY
jgi:hypothetical protein